MKYRIIIPLSILILASLACNLVTNAFNTAKNPGEAMATQVTDALATEMSSALATVETSTEELATAEPQQPPAGQDIKSQFPLPTDVSDYMELGPDVVNFQTGMSLKDAIAFYRDSFAKQGYTERENNTIIAEDQTFSMVFDGHPSGKAIVVQGVVIGKKVNINIRLEDI